MKYQLGSPVMSRPERFGTITDIKIGPTIRKTVQLNRRLDDDSLNDKINSNPIKSNQRSKIYHGSDRNFDTDR